MRREEELRNLLKRIGNNIQRLRSEKKVTREELASHLSYFAALELKEYEEGSREMGVFSLVNIAEALAVKPEMLLE